MATKKQKRDALEAKRARREAELARIGLEAQQRDRAERERKRRIAEAEAARINARHAAILMKSIHKEES